MKGKKRFSKKLWTVLTSVFCVLLAVLLAATAVANHFYTSINAFLLCDTYKVVSTGEAGDTNYFPDEWEGYDDWFSYYEEELCTRTEAEGAVLMKNENGSLPLPSGAKVSLFSHSSVEMIYGGTGSGSVNTATAPNLRKGLESAGAEVNPTLWSFYNSGNGASYKRTIPHLSYCAAMGDYTINEVPWSVLEGEAGLTDSFAQYGNAAIFVLARSGGEGLDLTGCTDAGTNGDYLSLSNDERDTLAQLNPGQSEDVTVTVPKELMKAYDAYGAGTYIVDAGDYYLTVGTDSHNAVNNILAAKGCTTMDAPGDETLVYHYTQDKLDTETYSVSTATGAAIVNRFDNVDLNLYEGSATKVTYLSRSDWMGTWPTETTVITVTEQMAKDIANEYVPLTTDESGKPYTMPLYNQKNGLTLAMLMGKDYDDPLWEDLLDQMSFAEQEDIIINGFHNTKTAASISKPATVETNGPQGITDSFFGGKKAGMAYPAEVVMASTWSTDIMEEIGSNIGIQGLKTHTNGLFGPGANIHRNPYCGRNYEYFSEDAFLAGAMMAPEIKGIQSHGVYAFMKHFALNDQETNRAGVTVWANEQAIREAYLAAWEPSVVQSDIKGAMTIMNRIGTEWGGACHGLLTDVLRGEWGFQGMVITDYSSNSNFTVQTKGLEGGTDLWDGFAATDITDKSNDPYICQLMRQAMHRILYVQANSSAMNGLSSTDRVVSVLTWWQIVLIAVDVTMGLLAAGSAAMLVVSHKKQKGTAQKS